MSHRSGTWRTLALSTNREAKLPDLATQLASRRAGPERWAWVQSTRSLHLSVLPLRTGPSIHIFSYYQGPQGWGLGSDSSQHPQHMAEMQQVLVEWITCLKTFQKPVGPKSQSPFPRIWHSRKLHELTPSWGMWPEEKFQIRLESVST